MFLKIHKSNIKEKSFWSFIRHYEFNMRIYLIPNIYLGERVDRNAEKYSKININIYDIKKYLVRKIVLKTYTSNINLTLPMDGKYYAYKEITTDCSFIINVKDEFFVFNLEYRGPIHIHVNNSALRGIIVVEIADHNNKATLVDGESNIYRVGDIIYKVVNTYGTIPAGYRIVDRFNFFFSVDPYYFLSHDLILTTNNQVTLKDIKYYELYLKGQSGSRSIYIDRHNLLRTTLENLFPRGLISLIDCKRDMPNCYLPVHSYEDIARYINRQLYVVYINEVGIDQGSIMKDYILVLGKELQKDRRISYGKNGFAYLLWKECTCEEFNRECTICCRERLSELTYYDSTEKMPSILFFSLLAYYVIIALKTNSPIPIKFSYVLYSLLCGVPIYLRSVQDEKIMRIVRYEQNEWINDFAGILDDLNVENRNEALMECAFLYDKYYRNNYRAYNILYSIFQMFIFERKKDLFCDLAASFALFSNISYENIYEYENNAYGGCCASDSYIVFNERINNLNITPIGLYMLLTGIAKIEFSTIRDMFIFKNFDTRDDPEIKWFFEIIKEFYTDRMEEFKNFIRFATGSESLTYTDIYIYKIKICITKVEGTDQYIKSASCSKTILISSYTSKRAMEQKIIDSAIMGSEFLIS